MKKDFLKTATFNQNVFIDENIEAVPLHSNNIIRLIDVIENGSDVKNKRIIVDRTLLEEDYDLEEEELNVRSHEGTLGLHFLVNMENVLIDDICSNVTPKDVVGIIADEEVLYQDLREFTLDLNGAGTAYTNDICADVVTLMIEKHGYEFDYPLLKELIVKINSIKVTQENLKSVVPEKVLAVQELDNYISCCIYDFLASKMNKEDITLKDVIDHFTSRTLPIYNENGQLIDRANNVEKLVYEKKKL